MKPFTILVIKVLALYLALTTLYAFIPVLLSKNILETFTPSVLIIIAATVLLPIIGAIILWKFANQIAEKIHIEEYPTPAVNSVDIVNAGIFLIAIWLFIKHIGILLNYYLTLNEVNYQSIFMIAISLILLLQPVLLTKLYKKLNNR